MAGARASVGVRVVVLALVFVVDDLRKMPRNKFSRVDSKP